MEESGKKAVGRVDAGNDAEVRARLTQQRPAFGRQNAAVAQGVEQRSNRLERDALCAREDGFDHLLVLLRLK